MHGAVTRIYDNISFNSSQNEKCFRQETVQEIKMRFNVQIIFFSESLFLRDNVEKYGTARQVTNDIYDAEKIFSYRITKVTI